LLVAGYLLLSFRMNTRLDVGLLDLL
jgi:hypothetical protein